jgi:hypothetical protein
MAEAYQSKRFFYINSANRVSGSSAAFAVPLQIPANEQYNACCVVQASIPISYYLIPDGSNTFQLQEGASVVTITIPAGNYNISSFCTVVSALLTSNSPHSWTYTMAYPSSYTQNNSGKITYTVSGSTSTPSFIFLNNYLNEQFGFGSGATVTFVGTILTSTNVVNYINETTLFIHSDVVSNGSDDILQEIYGSNSQALSVITFLCPEIKGYSKSLKTPKSQIINIYITDENNKPINLNGQNMQITLLCYRREDYRGIVINFIDICKQFIKYIISNIAGESHNENYFSQ